MATEPSPPVQVQMQVHWPDVLDISAVLANQFAVQFFQGSAIFVFGQSVPPVFAGTPEEQVAHVRDSGSIPIRVLGRYVVPLEALREIAAALQRTVETVDAQIAAGSASEASSGDAG